MTIKTFDNSLNIALKSGSIFFTIKNKISFNKASSIIALFLFVLTFSISSSAATFTVNTVNDGNDNIAGNGTCASGFVSPVCTLRAAVQEANALAGDDTIVFAPALANQTIRLSSLIGNDLDIGSNILIDATGVNGITVAGESVVALASRIFQIQANTMVTMNNFKIAEGRLLVGVLGGGGGIFATGSNLTLNNMTVEDNSVLVTGNGGGIYVAGGTLTLNDSVVDDNSVTIATSGGGGIFATLGAVVNINRSRISNNSALVDGGGILNTAGSVLNVNNSRISNNVALVDGGGVLNTSGSTLNLTESTVNNNFALGLGSGVANRAVALVITRANIRRSLINDNGTRAIVGTVGGGAISNVGTDIISDAVMVITNSTITDNEATVLGGGISNTLGDMHLTNNTISHNNSTVGGGGVVNIAGLLGLGTVYVRNNIIAKNNDLLGTNIIGTDALGIFNSLGNNLIGSNFSVEVSFEASLFAGVTPQPNANADIVGSVVIANQIIDPLLGALQDNGGPTFTRAITAASPAFNRANNCVFTNTCATNPQNFNPPSALPTDQRSTGFTRLSGVAVDIGAFELQLGVTSARVQIAGRITAGKRGLARTLVYLHDLNGDIRMTRANPFGYYRFSDVEVGKTYILEAKSKQFHFDQQVLNLTEEMLDLNFSTTNSGLKYINFR